MPPMKRAAAVKEEAPAQKDGGLKLYRIITDREPVWDDARRKKNELIRGAGDDRAILAMLERKWIEEVNE